MSSSSKHAFIASLRSEREAVLGAVAALDEATLTTVPVCGTWTGKDVLGHLAAVDRVLAQALRQSRAGEPVVWPWDSATDGDSWNAAEVGSRRDRTAYQALAEVAQTHADVLAEVALYPDSWDADGSPFAGWAEHDREHAAALVALARR
jgi:uncharacterized damage-inducible protein DinB